MEVNNNNKKKELSTIMLRGKLSISMSIVLNLLLFMFMLLLFGGHISGLISSSPLKILVGSGDYKCYLGSGSGDHIWYIDSNLGSDVCKAIVLQHIELQPLLNIILSVLSNLPVLC